MHLDVGTTSHLFVNNLDLGASSLVQYNCGNAEKEAGVVLEANARHLFALVKFGSRKNV